MAGLTLVERLDALARALRAGRDVLPADLVARAQDVEARAGQRLRLSHDHTVAAFAGSTGSGKSSLLNAVVGQPLAEVDVLRPTTAEALAVVRDGEGAGPLLDWLGVRRRHELAAGPVVAERQGARRPDGATERAGSGLILLDLPDHDSVQTGHRLEAERLVALVDLMVWVVDPQKYADAAVHERYLRGLSSHAGVLLIVLNQVDRLTSAERAQCHADLERLLADDGLQGVRLLDVSARTGEGIDELRAALDEAALRREAAQARLLADVVSIGTQIADRCGERPARPDRATTALVTELERAAGVPVIVEAVRSARTRRARQATGWPPTRWLSRFRPDPLRRLHLDQPGGDPDLVRTSVPPPGPAEQAGARRAVREYAERAGAGVPDAWALATRRAASEREDDLAARLDRSVAGTRVVGTRRPLWWSVVGSVQWLLLVVLVGGLLWLGALAAMDALLLPAPQPPTWGEIPWPTLAAAGGAVAGLLLAGVARLAAAAGGRRAARRATADLRAAITEVAAREVVAPVDDVLDRMAACRAAAEASATVGRAGRRSGRQERR